MPSLVTRILLCVSSYFPLIVIFAVQFYFRGPRWLGIASLAFGTLGLIGTGGYLRRAVKFNPMTVTIESVSRRDGEAMSYVVSYLLPFIALPSGDAVSIACLLVFLIVLGGLYVNSDMMHINPILNFAGWHLYEIALEGGDTRTLITRKRARKGRTAKTVQMADDILLEVD